MTPDPLKVEFRANNVVPGRPYVLRTMDAIRLIRRAAELRLPVRSVAGLVMRPGETFRSIDHVVDFSTAPAKGDGSWAPAEQFVAQRQDLGIVFEVMLGEHLDGAV
jgi:hypothetical protein